MDGHTYQPEAEITLLHVVGNVAMWVIHCACMAAPAVAWHLGLL
jgi:hypothetical protein